jgi:hypothetical protein
MSTTFEAIRAEALFVSWLQASQAPAPEQVREVITKTLRQRGSRGCAAAVAQEFGEHPETAAARMTWALSIVRAVYPTATFRLRRAEAA